MSATFLALVAGTLVSEDLTCILAGVLIHSGQLHPLAGVSACALGIYGGDLGLWAAGRLLGSRALAWPRVGRHVTAARHARFDEWFSRHAATLILASRFLPGTRLPLYVAAGTLRGSFARFAAWSLVAVVLWTPAVVLLSARLSGVSFVAVLLAYAGWRVGRLTITRKGRQRLHAALSRVWRWEFWPMWLFYAPVAVWTAWLAIRHRGIGAVSVANPGMPDGGIVGESKHAILARLPEEWTIPSFKVDPGADDERIWMFMQRLASRRWVWPLVCKPDVGQRGAGVKLVRSLEQARQYLVRERGAVLVQPYHTGPHEAGVFYYRMPGWPRGRILSITDKHFPVLIGDGRSTFEELIWADARLRMQAATFLKRHEARRDQVLAKGERLSLAIAGNHAQGTLFKDGRHLITSALEDRIDRIARSYHGFFVGRFDVRYGDVERFKAGEDLAIVELNGATAESTNIYDPESSLLGAYCQLFRQWSLVFAIGAANRAAGAPASSTRRVVELVRAHLSSRLAFETSD